MSKEVMKLALEALESTEYPHDHYDALVALREALAAPVQETAAVKHMMRWVESLKRKSDYGQYMSIPGLNAGACFELAIELEQFINTTPPAQPAVPLTDEEIYEMYNEPRSDAEMIAFARAIEAAHGITNGGAA